jgi:hypothetical protein
MPARSSPKPRLPEALRKTVRFVRLGGRSSRRLTIGSSYISSHSATALSPGRQKKHCLTSMSGGKLRENDFRLPCAGLSDASPCRGEWPHSAPLIPVHRCAFTATTKRRRSGRPRYIVPRQRLARLFPPMNAENSGRWPGDLALMAYDPMPYRACLRLRCEGSPGRTAGPNTGDEIA